MDFDTLFAFAMATAALAISPGPDNMYVLSQSLSFGKKSGLACTAGLVTGCLVHTSLLAFGLSSLLRASPEVFLLIRILGAIYLFYLAYKAFRSQPLKVGATDDAGRSRRSSLFRQGFIMNVLNPKVTLFFLAFFPAFLFSAHWPMVLQFYTLGLLFMLITFMIFSSIAFLSGSISGYLKSRPLIIPLLKWMQVITFIALGIYLLISDY